MKTFQGCNYHKILIESMVMYEASGIFICVGKEDFLYEDVMWLHNALEKGKILHRFDDLPGFKHEYAFWDMELGRVIRYDMKPAD